MVGRTGKGMEKKEEAGMIKKGPWSPKEDEILLNFVKINGPKDWSSLRSNGLLPRTGKSCRLRWVNKLRPNLKVGCKFTAEEERIVVELQARFGNKWAKIASYLEGRTDNDVKNFWSSRQKRLARMLVSSSHTATRKRHKKCLLKLPLYPLLPSDSHVPNSSNSRIVVTKPSPSNQPLNTNIVALEPGPMVLKTGPPSILEPQIEPKLSVSQPKQPSPSPLRQLQPQPPSTIWCTSTTLTPDHDQMKDLEPIFAEPISCLDLFPCSNPSDLDHHVIETDLGWPFSGGLMEGGCSKSGVQGDAGDQNLANPDGFFDDFSYDLFDSLDPLLEFIGFGSNC